MAVLIECMEMPKSCDDCYIANCPNDIGYTDRGKCSRHINCPIIEVPEPHGRLIDADALTFEDDYYGWRDKKVVKAAPIIILASEEVDHDKR